MNTILAFTLLTAASASSATLDCDIRCKIQRALNGDPTAALAVAEESKKTQTHQVMVYWYQIAAENGSPEGQDTYANILASESTEKDGCLRALFWFEKAKQGGNNHAATAEPKLKERIRHMDDFAMGCGGGL